MARQVSVQGKITGIPGLYQRSITLAGPQTPGVLESGTVAIVGECRGAIQPGVAFEIRSPSPLKAALGSGALYDAARFAFAPSRNPDVKGAAKVIAVRVNPATAAALVLYSSAPAGLITLASVPYGSSANALRVAVAAGSQGGLGRKITTSKAGENDEIGDDLGFLPPLLVRYSGDATTATITVSNTQITTTLAGDQTDSSVNLTIAFAAYPTLQDIIDFINSQIGYEAVAGIPTAATFLPANMDKVTGGNIKTETATISLASTTATTFTGTYTGLDNNDIIRVGSEYLFVTDTGTPTVIRGYIGSTAAVHSSAAAVTFLPISATTYAMIDWINRYSSRITATRASDSNVGMPATLSATYMTGGGEGTTSNSNWLAALNALVNTSINYLVVCSDSTTVHGYVKSHMATRWGVGSSEAIAHVGSAVDDTKTVIRSRAKALQDPNTCLWFQEAQREDDKGVATWYAPWALAAMAAGIQAGTPIGEPLTYKRLEVSSIRNHSSIDLVGNDDLEDLIEDGVCSARFYDEDYRVVRALTTYSGSENSYEISPSVRTAVAWTVKKVRARVRLNHFAKRGASGDVGDIKGTIVATLEEVRDVDGAIVEGSRRVNGADTLIPAFDSVEVSRTDNTITPRYRITPVDGNEFFLFDSEIGRFQAVA